MFECQQVFSRTTARLAPVPLATATGARGQLPLGQVAPACSCLLQQQHSNPSCLPAAVLQTPGGLRPAPPVAVRTGFPSTPLSGGLRWWRPPWQKGPPHTCSAAAPTSCSRCRLHPEPQAAHQLREAMSKCAMHRGSRMEDWGSAGAAWKSRLQSRKMPQPARVLACACTLPDTPQPGQGC